MKSDNYKTKCISTLISLTHVTVKGKAGEVSESNHFDFKESKATFSNVGTYNIVN